MDVIEIGNIIANIYNKTISNEMEWEVANSVEAQRLFLDASSNMLPTKVYFSIGKNDSIVAVGTFEENVFDSEGESRSNVIYLFAIGKTAENSIYGLGNSSIKIKVARTYSDNEISDSLAYKSGEPRNLKDLFNAVTETFFNEESFINDF